MERSRSRMGVGTVLRPKSWRRWGVACVLLLAWADPSSAGNGWGSEWYFSFRSATRIGADVPEDTAGLCTLDSDNILPTVGSSRPRGTLGSIVCGSFTIGPAPVGDLR